MATNHLLRIKRKATTTNSNASLFGGNVDDFDFSSIDLGAFGDILGSIMLNKTKNNDCANRADESGKADHYDENKSIGWCAFFDGSSKVWLEIGVMLLAILSLIFLAICYGKAIRETSSRFEARSSLVYGTQHLPKKGTKMTKMVMTTIFLLGSFVIW